MTIKWSAFADAGNTQIGDESVGLRGTENVRFDFPGTGINDGAGNPLVGWVSAGPSAVNYVQFINAVSGQPPIITAQGEANAGLKIKALGSGSISLEGAVEDLQSLQVDNILLDGNTISSAATDENLILEGNGTGSVNVGAPSSFDGNQVILGGVPSQFGFKINDFDNTNVGMMGIFKHSTSFFATMGGFLSNTDDDTIVPVTNGQPLYAIAGGGAIDTNGYGIFGAIVFSADSSGTISPTSAPGALYINVTPDGGLDPIPAIFITNDGTTNFLGDIVCQGDATFFNDVTFGTGDGELLIGSSGNPAVKAQLTQGANTVITNGPGSIEIASTGNITWNEITSPAPAMLPNNGYLANDAVLVDITLPANFVKGEIFEFVAVGAGLFRISQNAGQTIHIGASATTTGVGGSITATAQYDSIKLVATADNTDVACLGSPQGTFTVV